MKSFLIFLIPALCGGLGISRSIAQTALTTGSTAPTPAGGSTPTTADRQWSAIKSFGRATAANPAASVAARMSRAEEITLYVGQADQLRNFYSQFPAHSAAREAKWLEALALNRAALRGNSAHEPRRQQVLDEIRADTSLGPEKRFEAIAWSHQVTISRQAVGSRTAHLQLQESATRALIAEFPVVAHGYESLLAIARDSSPDRGIAIAGELIAMAAAPAATKAEARITRDRFALIDQSIDQIFLQHSATGLAAIRADKVTALYGWSSKSPRTLEFIRQLSARTPEVVFVGICLDADVDAAKRIAAATPVGGTQYYDQPGTAARLATALRFGRAPAVYLVDRAGIVRDVQARDNFQAKVASLVKEAQR